MAPKPQPQNIAPNGKIIVHALKRVLPHNVGDIFGVDEKTYEALCDHKKGQAVELATRLVMLEDAPNPSVAPCPPLKKGQIVAVSAGYAKQLLADKKAELATTEHDKRDAATRAEIDRKNAEEMAEANKAALLGKANTPQKVMNKG